MPATSLSCIQVVKGLLNWLPVTSRQILGKSIVRASFSLESEESPPSCYLATETSLILTNFQFFGEGVGWFLSLSAQIGSRMILGLILGQKKNLSFLDQARNGHFRKHVLTHTHISWHIHKYKQTDLHTRANRLTLSHAETWAHGYKYSYS